MTVLIFPRLALCLSHLSKVTTCNAVKAIMSKPNAASLYCRKMHLLYRFIAIRLIVILGLGNMVNCKFCRRWCFWQSLWHGLRGHLVLISYWPTYWSLDVRDEKKIHPWSREMGDIHLNQISGNNSLKDLKPWIIYTVIHSLLIRGFLLSNRSSDGFLESQHLRIGKP